MDDLFDRLEKKILKLIDEQRQLKVVNNRLHQVKNLLSHEKECLVMKQHKAISQIKNLVSRLKAWEKTP